MLDRTLTNLSKLIKFAETVLVVYLGYRFGGIIADWLLGWF